MVRHSYRQQELSAAYSFVSYFVTSSQLQYLMQNKVAVKYNGGTSSPSLYQKKVMVEILQAILQTIDDLQAKRYFRKRITVPKTEKMIDKVGYFAVHNHHRYRGFMRMTPAAFDDLAARLKKTTPFLRCSNSTLHKRLAVAMHRLGRAGNGGSVRDVASACGCSEASTILWASESERAVAKKWVANRCGVDEWEKGWAVVDGTHINLAFKPGRHHREYYNYKRNYSMNVQLVMLPHSLRIIECVIGFPGSAQDSRVWAAGSKVLRKPRLYLDEGEFIWTDGGYGHSAFTLAPYTNSKASGVKDLARFNYQQSRIRSRAEHGIAYLKNRFQVLTGYRGNLYREQDEMNFSKVVMACIVAHTIASAHDKIADIETWLNTDNMDGSLFEGGLGAAADLETATVCAAPLIDKDLFLHRQQAQQAYEEQSNLEKAQRGSSSFDHLRKQRALDLREEMHLALFEAHDWDFVDTDKSSRRKERAC
ncbi:hypothetical protein CBS101457_002964 [Exobasidium rhododendri]|nr:hypothetical protein CBS101457_002964 [Exobasidium rhododendri]